MNFLSTFAKSRKATVDFIMSIRPSVCMKQLGSHWTDFHEICCLNIYSKICQENPSSITI
jgi:hypothetical protein